MFSRVKLEEAEKSILKHVKTPYRAFYVEMESNNGKRDKIWTVAFNEQSQETSILLVHGLGAG